MDPIEDAEAQIKKSDQVIEEVAMGILRGEVADPEKESRSAVRGARASYQRAQALVQIDMAKSMRMIATFLEEIRDNLRG